MIVGIDPGVEPSICILKDEVIQSNVLLKKVGGKIDVDGIKEIIDSLEDNAKIFVEDVHSVFGSSAKANFNFGKSIGVIQAITKLSKNEVIYVTPKEWQKIIWEGEDTELKDNNRRDTKKTSLNSVKRILGNNYDIDLFKISHRATKVNHNLVDSFLISWYGNIVSKI